MNSFFENLYDSVKDRRYGMLFFTTFLGFLVLVVFGTMIFAIAGANGWGDFILPALPGIGIFIVVLGWRLIRRTRKRRRERLQYPPMSRDELRKARSKLVNKNKT